MFYRRKILLALLQTFGGNLHNTDFQKYLFLFTRAQDKPSFDFVPYKYGGFSFQSYADKRTMAGFGLIEDQENWTKKDKKDYFSELSVEDKEIMAKTKQRYGHLKGKKLVRHVYLNYPYYAVKSEIAGQYLDKDGLAMVDKCRPHQNNYGFFTIGYEGKTLDYYLNQLVENNVYVLCDVRRNPISMKYGFSRNQLKETCEKLGIEYVHFPELGIESSKRQNLCSRKDYERLFEEYEKKALPANIKSLEKLYRLFLDKKRVAITCFEADHTLCHRHKIAKRIEKQMNRAFKIEHL